MSIFQCFSRKSFKNVANDPRVETLPEKELYFLCLIKIVLSKIQKLITCAKNWASHAPQTWKEKQVLTNFSLTDAAADFCCRSVE